MPIMNKSCVDAVTVSRAWRARRRRNNSDDDMHLDNEEDEVDTSGNWIDWSVFKVRLYLFRIFGQCDIEA